MMSDMDFDAATIEQAAIADGADAIEALCADYHRKTVQFFGACVVLKKIEGIALATAAATAAAVQWAEAIRALPGWQIDRADFDELPIFEFDYQSPDVPAGAHRLRFGDTWLVWKRAFSFPRWE